MANEDVVHCWAVPSTKTSSVDEDVVHSWAGPCAERVAANAHPLPTDDVELPAVSWTVADFEQVAREATRISEPPQAVAVSRASGDGPTPIAAAALAIASQAEDAAPETIGRVRSLVRQLMTSSSERLDLDGTRGDEGADENGVPRLDGNGELHLESRKRRRTGGAGCPRRAGLLSLPQPNTNTNTNTNTSTNTNLQHQHQHQPNPGGADILSDLACVDRMLQRVQALVAEGSRFRSGEALTVTLALTPTVTVTLTVAVNLTVTVTPTVTLTLALTLTVTPTNRSPNPDPDPHTRTQTQTRTRTPTRILIGARTQPTLGRARPSGRTLRGGGACTSSRCAASECCAT